MTPEQKQAIYDIVINYWTTDDPELKKLALDYNATATDAARKLHADCLIVDGCTFYLENYNWQLAESKAACLNMTVPSVFDPSAGGVVAQVADLLHVVRADPEHFINILSVDDIREAHRSGRIGILLGAQNCDFMLRTRIHKRLSKVWK